MPTDEGIIEDVFALILGTLWVLWVLWVAVDVVNQLQILPVKLSITGFTSLKVWARLFAEQLTTTQA